MNIKYTSLILICVICCNFAFADANDFNLDGVFEAALDLPHIWFLLKRDPNGQPLEYLGNFEANWAYLDTGASGILLSRETTDYMEIQIDPLAEYADVGVGGIEFFDVSEPLYIAVANYNDPDPLNLQHYHALNGPWRFQIKQTYAGGGLLDEPLDILGIPVMAGKVVVLNSEGPNLLEYFTADILEPNDSNIPPVDFNVALRFANYTTPESPENTPPLPVLAYNPVIDNVTAENGPNSATGSWLLDTGATVSLMSIPVASQLGLVDSNGTPLVPLEFEVAVGGIGSEVNIPGFQIDNLIIPTLNGYSLVYNNARIGVLNIGIVDPQTDEVVLIDGVFGSNFLVASAKLGGGLFLDLAEGAFEKVVIDMNKGLLGFNVIDTYPLPPNGTPTTLWPPNDFNHDFSVDFLDLLIFTDHWLNDCNWLNFNCIYTDMNQDGKVDARDYAHFTN